MPGRLFALVWWQLHGSMYTQGIIQFKGNTTCLPSAVVSRTCSLRKTEGHGDGTTQPRDTPDPQRRREALQGTGALVCVEGASPARGAAAAALPANSFLSDHPTGCPSNAAWTGPPSRLEDSPSVPYEQRISDSGWMAPSLDPSAASQCPYTGVRWSLHLYSAPAPWGAGSPPPEAPCWPSPCSPCTAASSRLLQQAGLPGPPRPPLLILTRRKLLTTLPITTLAARPHSRGDSAVSLPTPPGPSTQDTAGKPNISASVQEGKAGAWVGTRSGPTPQGQSPSSTPGWQEGSLGRKAALCAPPALARPHSVQAFSSTPGPRPARACPVITPSDPPEETRWPGPPPQPPWSLRFGGIGLCC